MANFFANTAWNINNIDLNFYADNLVDTELQQGGSFPANGSVYPDYFYVLADSGSDQRRFDLFGMNVTVNALGFVTGGQINAAGEVDIGSGTTRWFIDGISLSASATFNAALSSSPSDEIALIESAFGGNDTINLSPFDDQMSGYGGNDSIKGFGGNDILDGGSGIDTAYFDASFIESTISFDGAVVVVSSGIDGTDRLTNFEFVSFNGDVRSVSSLNSPPVANPATINATEDGPIVNGQLQATDQEGSALTFSLTSATAGLTISQTGSYSFNPSNSAFQSLAQGEMTELLATYSVSDGLNSDSSTVTIEVTGVNDEPSFLSLPGQLDVIFETPLLFSATAVDPEGDTLTFTASDPDHGTVTGGAGGQFVYTPDEGFTGSDSVTVTVSDSNGGSVTRTLAVFVAAGDNAPVAEAGEVSATEDGPVVSGQLVAKDPNGDNLTFSAMGEPVPGLIINADGTYSFEPGDEAYQSLADGEIVEIVTGFSVSDGENSAGSTLTITLTGQNDAPVILPVAFEFATIVDTPRTFTVSARDADGDLLSYASLEPDHGSVIAGESGEFTYVPDPGFTGTDSVTVTVSDGNGGNVMQTFVVTVSDLLPELTNWNLLLTDGFAGSIGGYGNVFGTSEFQDITVLDLPGAIIFDPSFNKAGNIVRFSGTAADWQIVQSSSAATLTDGDTYALIPAGAVGIGLVFDDGVRTLRIDTAEATLKIGNQAFGEELVQITAPADQVLLPTGQIADAAGRLIFLPGGDVAAEGNFEVFGTSSRESMLILSGNAEFDPSYNKGGDILRLEEPASAFSANREGSSVFLDGPGVDLLFPVGLAGMEIEFGVDDIRTVLFDTDLGQIVIGGQQIGFDPITLAAAV